MADQESLARRQPSAALDAAQPSDSSEKKEAAPPAPEADQEKVAPQDKREKDVAALQKLGLTPANAAPAFEQGEQAEQEVKLSSVAQTVLALVKEFCGGKEVHYAMPLKEARLGPEQAKELVERIRSRMPISAGPDEAVRLVSSSETVMDLASQLYLAMLPTSRLQTNQERNALAKQEDVRTPWASGLAVRLRNPLKEPSAIGFLHLPINRLEKSTTLLTRQRRGPPKLTDLELDGYLRGEGSVAVASSSKKAPDQEERIPAWERFGIPVRKSFGRVLEKGQYAMASKKDLAVGRRRKWTIDPEPNPQSYVPDDSYALIHKSDNWREKQMYKQADGVTFKYAIPVEAGNIEEFQILGGGNYNRVMYPPPGPHPSGTEACGPGFAEHRNWLVYVPEGARECSILFQSVSKVVSWTFSRQACDVEEFDALPESQPQPQPSVRRSRNVDTLYYLTGNWNNWRFKLMEMAGHRRNLTCHVDVPVEWGNIKKFQIIANKDWTQRYTPPESYSSSLPDAINPIYSAKTTGGMTKDVRGPSDIHGENWSIEVPPGMKFMRITWLPRDATLRWEFY